MILPNIGKIKIHVPNHQPVIDFLFLKGQDATKGSLLSRPSRSSKNILSPCFFAVTARRPIKKR